jgi:hypothetical protein
MRPDFLIKLYFARTMVEFALTAGSRAFLERFSNGLCSGNGRGDRQEIMAPQPPEQAQAGPETVRRANSSSAMLPAIISCI